MFDNKMIVPDSLENVEEGFAFQARLPYYRGLGLSMVEDLAVTIDGEAVPREAVLLELRGRRWTLEEMEMEYGDRWNFGEKARVIVCREAPLTTGKHRIELAERLRISYLPMVPTTRDAKDLTI
jgi:hypothetical protein